MKLPQGYDAVTGEALPSLSATGMPWAGVLEARSALRGKAAPDLQKSPPFPWKRRGLLLERRVILHVLFLFFNLLKQNFRCISAGPRDRARRKGIGQVCIARRERRGR